MNLFKSRSNLIEQKVMDDHRHKYGGVGGLRLP